MDDQIKRIEDKIDKMLDHQASIDITLAKQSVILEEHVKRSNMLEAKLIPVEKHVYRVNGALKLISVLAMIAGIVEVVLKCLGK